jgi:predicted transcriptional regulator
MWLTGPIEDARVGFVSSGARSGIARGERAIEEGRTVSHAEAKRRMERWLK